MVLENLLEHWTQNEIHYWGARIQSPTSTDLQVREIERIDE